MNMDSLFFSNLDAGLAVLPTEDRIIDANPAASELLGSLELLNEQAGDGSLKLLATDGVTRFARVGGQFLGHALNAQDIVLTDL